jgi:hypothetical protein
MFSVKVSTIAAGIGFVLSFLVSIAAGVRAPELILRPIIFAFVFFIAGSSAYFLIVRFLGELLDPEEGVNVLVGEEYGDHHGVLLHSLSGGEPHDAAHEAPSMGDGTAMPTGGLGNTVPTDDTSTEPSKKQQAFAKLSENFGNDADPKKMASTIQGLLLDDLDFGHRMKRMKRINTNEYEYSFNSCNSMIMC